MNPIEPERHHGKLVKWDDSRGFGFIEPSDGGKNIFVHIKDIRPGERRPVIGDTVYYEVGAGNQGKPKAINAFIAGVKPLPPAPQIHQQSVTNYRKPVRRLRRSEIRAYAMAAMSVIFLGMVVVSCSVNLISRYLNHGVDPATTRSDHAQPAKVYGPYPAAVPDPSPLGPIKGNISYSNGARYYHTPGMRDYDITQIDPTRGERYFRTEAEAQAAGWTRAPGK